MSNTVNRNSYAPVERAIIVQHLICSLLEHVLNRVSWWCMNLCQLYLFTKILICWIIKWWIVLKHDLRMLRVRLAIRDLDVSQVTFHQIWHCQHLENDWNIEILETGQFLIFLFIYRTVANPSWPLLVMKRPFLHWNMSRNDGYTPEN